MGLGTLDLNVGGGTLDILNITNSQINLSNKNLIDNSTFIINVLDATKRLGFDLSGTTTGITGKLLGSFTANRNVTLPDATTTLAGLSVIETFTSLQTFTGGLTSLAGANFILQDPTDTTKQLEFGLSGITTGVTKTLSVNKSLTLDGVDGKTLTLNDSTTLATNSITFAGGEILTLTALKNVTFNNQLSFSGIDGKTLTINKNLTLDGLDGKTLTLSDSTTLATNSITFAGGEILTLTALKNVTFNNQLSFSGVDGKTLTINKNLTLDGADGKTLTLSDSTTLATNAITFAGTEVLTLASTKNVTFADAFSTSGLFPLTLTTTALTNATLPSGTITLVDLSSSQALTNKTISGLTITTTTGTLTIALGKTATISNTLTFAGTDGKTLTLTNGLTVNTNDGTLAFGAASKTLTINKNLTLDGTDATTITFQGTDTYIGRLTTDTGANRVKNKDLEAGTLNIVDATDTAKKFAWSLSGQSTNTTLTVATAQTTSQTLNIPNITGADTIDVLGLAQTISAVKTFSATTAFTNSSPFSVANAQTLTFSVAAQTIGAATLTIPNFAGVSDTLVFQTLAAQGANRLKNKDLEAGTFNIVDGTDTTKKLTWSLSGMTTAKTLTISSTQTTTQTLSIPNITAADTLPTLGLTQTFSALNTFSNGVSIKSGTNPIFQADVTNGLRIGDGTAVLGNDLRNSQSKTFIDMQYVAPTSTVDMVLQTLFRIQDTVRRRLDEDFNSIPSGTYTTSVQADNLWTVGSTSGLTVAAGTASDAGGVKIDIIGQAADGTNKNALVTTAASTSFNDKPANQPMIACAFTLNTSLNGSINSALGIGTISSGSLTYGFSITSASGNNATLALVPPGTGTTSTISTATSHLIIVYTDSSSNIHFIVDGSEVGTGPSSSQANANIQFGVNVIHSGTLLAGPELTINVQYLHYSALRVMGSTAPPKPPPKPPVNF